MSKTLQDKLKELNPERRAKIKSRAAQLIAQEMTMRDLRKALNLTQKELSERLDMTQDNISRLENRSDILLSTLSVYIHALGGDLSLVANFPDRPPVRIAGIAEIEESKSEENRVA